MRRPGEGGRPQGRQPLRRRPKQLTEEPTLFEPGRGSGSGTVLLGRTPRRPGAQPRQRGGSAPGETEEEGELVTLTPDPTRIDPVVRARVRQIAARLAVPKPRRQTRARRGVGELLSVPYRDGSDDIDLDRTLEALVEHPWPEEGDITVRERTRARRSVVLAVDASGSMRGERVRTAAAAVAALAGELVRDNLAVVEFWSDAALIQRFGEPVQPFHLLDRLLQVPAQGLTNVAFPLTVAARELSGVPAREARVLLLSDCVHNAGPDPRPLAARLPRLDVLLDTTGEHDTDLARDLAREGRGRVFRIRHHRDVAPALSAAFS